MSKKREFILIYTIIAAYAITYVIFKGAFDSDPIWSIEIGKYIVNNGFPHVDPFSWTVAGKEWITHEWLFCIVMYYLNMYIGDWGFIVYIFICVVLIGLVVYKILKQTKASYIAYIISYVSLVVLFSWGVLQARAFLLTLVLIAAIIYLLREEKIWYIPLIILLWANWHSSVVLGMFILTIESLNRFISKKQLDFLKITVLSAIVGLINPYGYKIYTYVLSTLRAPETKTINEWLGAYFGNVTILVIYGSIIILAAIIWNIHIKTEDKLDNKQIMSSIWFWFFCVYSLNTSRMFMIAMIMFIIYVCYMTNNIKHKDYKVQKIVMLVAITALLINCSIGEKIWPKYTQDNNYPIKAIEFLKNNDEYNKNIFNEYVWGALLIKEDIKPFIDARCDVYMENGIMRDYNKASGLKEEPVKIFEKYGVDNILIRQNGVLDIYLRGRIEIREVYRDDVAVIYKIK